MALRRKIKISEVTNKGKGDREITLKELQDLLFPNAQGGATLFSAEDKARLDDMVVPSAFAKTLLDDLNAAAARATLGSGLIGDQIFTAGNVPDILALLAREPVAQTANYTVQTGDRDTLIDMDATSGNLVTTLPAAATAGSGFLIGVRKADVTANTVTVDVAGGGTINGVTTFILSKFGDTGWFISDGTEWLVAYNTDRELLGTSTKQEDVITTTGDLIVGDGSGDAVRLPVGTNGQVLQVSSGTPTWGGAAATSLPRGYIAAFNLSNNAIDTVNDIDISTGETRDFANTENIVSSAILTKRLDAAWAVGTNQGGLDTGTKAVSSTYHVHAIKRTDTGVVDILFSLSASSPTMPTSYDKRRRIGSIMTDASGNIIPFSQLSNDFLLKTPINSFNVSNPGTSAVLRVVSVPTGIKVLAHLGFQLADTSVTSVTQGIFTSPDQDDTAPSSTLLDISTLTSGATGQLENIHKRLYTNTSGQVRTRFSFSSTDHFFTVITYGWTDHRGRFE